MSTNALQITVEPLTIEKARLVLQHRLGLTKAYHNHIARSLVHDRRWMRRHTPYVGFCYDHGIPVGCGFLIQRHNQLRIGQFRHLISIYTRPAYRKLHIGSNLVHSLLTSNNLSKREVYAHSGIKGSRQFWYRQGIFCYPASDIVDIRLPLRLDEARPLIESELKLLQRIVRVTQTTAQKEALEQQGLTYLL